jgi:hypothetical protein
MLESFLDDRKSPSNIWVGCLGSKAQSSSPVQPPNPEGLLSGLPQVAQSHGELAGESAIRPAANDNDAHTFPPWLHDLFKQQIEELKQCFTHALIKPSSIREKYLAALMKHSPAPDDCRPCLMVHANKGEEYCVGLEQKLTHARNQASAALELQRFLCG